jgi:hypothetical protein
LVEGSATHNLVTGKIPTGGLRLLRKRTIASNFLGLSVMAGFTDGTTKPELQEYFGGGLLNRLYLNQGTGRPGDMVITTSATPPAGYRNIGGGMDLRNAVQSDGSPSTDGGGGGSVGGTFARQRQVRGQTRRRTFQGSEVFAFPNPNRQSTITSQNRGRFNTNFSGNYAVSLNTSFQVQEEQYNDNNKDDENAIFALITKIYSEEEIDKFTEDYNEEEKAKHAQKKAEQEQEEELVRLERLFKTKLDIFNIEAISNSENKELKSKIRRSKSDAEAIANAVILMMQEDNADV